MGNVFVKKEIRKYITVFFGGMIFAVGTNFFLVPLDLFSSGLLGIAQIIRSLLLMISPSPFLRNVDIAGILNFLLNLPLFFMAFKTISKNFFIKTLLSVASQTLFLTFIKVPAEPLLDDVLANCLMGGVICGVGIGVTLRSSGSGGGLDILGVYFTQKSEKLSVGKLALVINVILYCVCAALFNLETAVYSIIYMACYSLVLDRIHSQNINVTCLIFSKGQGVSEAIMEKTGRGVTSWKGMGDYTKDDTRIMAVVINKYEVAEVKGIIREIDPKAFIIFFEGIHVSGNFEKRL